MAYEKMTAAIFKQRLNEGHYKEALGARRAIGRASISGAERIKCNKLIDAHFGEETTTSKKPAATKKVGKKAANKREAKAPKPEKETKAASKRGGKKKAGRSEGESTQLKGTDSDYVLSQLRLNNERIGTIVQAIMAMKQAKDACPDLDILEGSQAALGGLVGSLQEVRRTVRDDEDTVTAADLQVLETLARTAPAAHGLPGYESPVQTPGTNGQTEVSNEYGRLEQMDTAPIS